AVAGAAVIIGQDRVTASCEVAGESPVDPARHGGGRIDQDGMAPGPAGQKQARAQQISVRGGDGDVVDENVVQPASATAISPVASRPPGKCEFGFCRKGLSRGAEIQLAVEGQPVYNPALRCPP